MADTSALLALPKVQITHGINWRGVIKTWQTVYRLIDVGPNAATQTAIVNAIIAMENSILYGGGPGQGGFLTGKYYQGAGGAPTATVTLGSLEGSGAWTPYLGDAWNPDRIVATGMIQPPEVCLMAEAPRTALSITGKPVTLKKYYHSVPVCDNEIDGQLGVDTDSQTGLNDKLVLLTNGDLPGGTVVVGQDGLVTASPFTVQLVFGNHQMYRRRKKATTAVATALGKVQLEGIL